MGEKKRIISKKPGGGEEREVPTSNGGLSGSIWGMLGYLCHKSKDVEPQPMGSVVFKADWAL